MCPRVAEQKLGIEDERKLKGKKERLRISFLMKARPELGLPIGIPAKNLLAVQFKLFFFFFILIFLLLKIDD